MSRVINISDEIRATNYATNLNSAIQYTYYTNALVLGKLYDLLNVPISELFLRYQAAVIGRQLNDVGASGNFTTANSPGTYLIAILQRNITLLIQFVDKAKQLGYVLDPTASVPTIAGPLIPIVEQWKINVLEIANLFTGVGGNNVPVTEGQTILNQYINCILLVVAAELNGNYALSLRNQTVLQTLGLSIADYLTRAIFGGRQVDYYIGDASFSGYGVPANITIDMLRTASAE